MAKATSTPPGGSAEAERSRHRRTAGALSGALRTSDALVTASAALVREARAEREVRRLAFLAEASRRLLLSDPLDPQATMATIAELGVPRVADRCVLYLLNRSGRFTRFALAPALDADERALFAWYEPSLSDAVGVGAVARDAEVFFSASELEERDVVGARAAEALPLMRAAGIGAMLLVPLRARGGVSGVLAFVNRRGRQMTLEERGLGEELAARGALALEHARLFEAEVRFAEQTRRLYAAQRALAEELQEALLPRELPVVEDLELAARYVSGTEGLDVGGDWYDAVVRPNGHVALIVGDVAGRGAHAASAMAALRFSFRGFVMEGRSPSTILRRCSFEQSPAEPAFATAVCAELDLQRRELRLASAGHLPPLVVERDRSFFAPLRLGPPLGIEPGRRYPVTRTALAPSSSVLLFTDGLVERRGKGIDDGLRRLLEATRGLWDCSCEELIDKVCTSLLEDAGPGADDVAVLGVKLRGG